MKYYIDKAAIVAEIDEIVKGLQKNCNPNPMGNIQECLAAAQIEALNLIKDFLDTLETKEVDLDESARHYLLHEHISPLNEVLHQADLKVEMQYHKDIENAYKAGFQLGLKTKKGE